MVSKVSIHQHREEMSEQSSSHKGYCEAWNESGGGNEPVLFIYSFWNWSLRDHAAHPQTMSLFYTGLGLCQQKSLSDLGIQDQETLHHHIPQARNKAAVCSPPAWPLSLTSQLAWSSSEREWFYPGSTCLVPSITPLASQGPKSAEKGKYHVLNGDPVGCLGSKQPKTSAIPGICWTLWAWLVPLLFWDNGNFTRQVTW